MRVAHHVVDLLEPVRLQLERRDVRRHGEPLQREHDVDGVLGRVRLHLELACAGTVTPCGVEHDVDRVLRRERVLLVGQGLHRNHDELRLVRGVLRLHVGLLRRLLRNAAAVHGHTDYPSCASCPLTYCGNSTFRLLPGMHDLGNGHVRRGRHALRRQQHSTTCNGEYGCTWSTSSSCSGTPQPCTSQVTQAACQARQGEGCTWNGAARSRAAGPSPRAKWSRLRRCARRSRDAPGTQASAPPLLTRQTKALPPAMAARLVHLSGERSP